MARPRKQVSNGRPRKQNDLASLSTEVLRIRLQALNLPIMGGKATLISCLNLATGTKQLCSTSNSQAGRARAKHLAPKSRPVRATLTALPQNPQLNKQIWRTLVMTLQTLRLVVTSTKSWRNFPQTTPRSCPSWTFHRRSTGYHTGHRQVLTRSSVSFPWSLGHDQQPGTFNTLHRRPGSASPVGLNRPLEQNLQDKILRGEYIDFSLLLPNSLTRPQAPDIQLRVDD